jgi:hypothetical protein
MKVIFDAEEIYSSGDNFHSISKEKSFKINNLWIALTVGQ